MDWETKFEEWLGELASVPMSLDEYIDQLSDLKDRVDSSIEAARSDRRKAGDGDGD